MNNNVPTVGDTVNNENQNSINSGFSSEPNAGENGGTSLNEVPTMPSQASQNSYIDGSVPNTNPTNTTTIENAQTSPMPNQNNAPKNKGTIKIAIIVIAILLIGGLAFGAYKMFFATSKTDMLKSAINGVYAEFSSSLEKLEKQKVDIDIFNDSLKLEGDFQIDGSTFAKLKDDKIDFTLGLDYKNKLMEASGKLSEKNKDLLDGKIILKNNHLYLKSDSLLNNIYDLGSYNFDDHVDLGDLENDLNSVDLPSASDIDFIVKEFKDALLNSLDEKNMKQEKVDLSINNTKVKATKITYTINKETMLKLAKNLATELNSNDNLKAKLVDIFKIDKDDYQDALDAMQDEKAFDSFEGEGEFSIYATGVTHQFAGAELIVKDGGKLAFYNSGDNAYFIFNEEESNEKIEITSVKEKDIYDVSIIMTEDNKANEVAKLTIRKLTNEEIDLDYDLNIEDTKANGSIKLTGKQNNKDITGTVEFSVNYTDGKEKYDVSFTANYKVTTGQKIATDNVTTAISSENITDEDMTKVKDKLTDLESSNIYDYLKDDFNFTSEIIDSLDESSNYSSIYDNQECWNNYWDALYNKQTFDGSYDEYYETYC